MITPSPEITLEILRGSHALGAMVRCAELLIDEHSQAGNAEAAQHAADLLLQIGMIDVRLQTVLVQFRHHGLPEMPWNPMADLPENNEKPKEN